MAKFIVFHHLNKKRARKRVSLHNLKHVPPLPSRNWSVPGTSPSLKIKKKVFSVSSESSRREQNRYSTSPQNPRERKDEDRIMRCWSTKKTAIEKPKNDPAWEGGPPRKKLSKMKQGQHVQTVHKLWRQAQSTNPSPAAFPSTSLTYKFIFLSTFGPD